MDSSNWYGGEYEMCKLIEKLKAENEALKKAAPKSLGQVGYDRFRELCLTDKFKELPDWWSLSAQERDIYRQIAEAIAAECLKNS